MAAAFLVRWQNDQGELLDHQLFIVRKTDVGSFEIDNRLISELLAAPTPTGRPHGTAPAVRKTELEAARDRVEVEVMASVSRFKHPNDIVLLGAAEAGEMVGDQMAHVASSPATSILPAS